MEDLDKDIVVFNDEEGNEIELEVVDMRTRSTP